MTGRVFGGGRGAVKEGRKEEGEAEERGSKVTPGARGEEETGIRGATDGGSGWFQGTRQDRGKDARGK